MSTVLAPDNDEITNKQKVEKYYHFYQHINAQNYFRRNQ